MKTAQAYNETHASESHITIPNLVDSTYIEDLVEQAFQD